MNTQATCPRCDERINEQWKVCGYCGYRFCDADHCTPEERAVIETAVARRQIERRLFPIGAPSSGDSLLDREFLKEQIAVDVLLAARTRPEKADDGTV